MLINIKRACLFVSILCMVSTSAYASHNEVSLNLKDYSVTIDGSMGAENAGKHYSVLMLNPGIDKALMPGEGGIQKIYEGVFDERGRYKLSFPVNTNLFLKYGNMLVRVNTEENSTFEKEVYFADGSELITALSEINSANTKTNEQVITVLESNADILDINTEAFKVIDKTKVAAKLSELVSAQQFTQSNISDLQKSLRETIILEALNQGKSAEMFDDNEICYESTVNLSSIDTKYDISAYSIYENELNDAGINNVKKSILGKNYESLTDLYKDFTKAIIVEGIRNNSANGYGHIERILSSNAAFVGMNINKYKSSATLDNKILQSGSSSIQEIENVISNSTVDKVITSSGGGGGGVSVWKQVVPQTNTDGISDLDVPAVLQAFNDLGDCQWAHGAIGELLKLDVISKSDDKLFRPKNHITREEFAKMIAVAFAFDEQTEEKNFVDISDSDWSSKYIYALVNAGIIVGKSETEFGKKDFLSRQDMATIIYRIYKTKGLQGIENESIIFDDAADIDQYALPAIEKLSSFGIISGNGNGLFNPKEFCTRAESAKVIYKLLLLENK